MKPSSRTIRLALAAILAAVLAPVAASAAWPHSPSTNLPISTYTVPDHIVGTCSDGAGGVIVGWWETVGTGSDIIVGQRYDATGRAVWGLGAGSGVEFSYWGYIDQSCALVPDGAGGVTAVSTGWANGSYPVRAYHYDAAGHIIWSTTVCNYGTAQRAAPVAVAGSDGKVIVAWLDWRNGNADVYTQCITSAGAVAWGANGLQLSTTTDNETEPCIVGDGFGGAIVAWRSQSATTGADIYLQRVYNGLTQWTSGGNLLTSAAGDQSKPALLADANHGAIIAWQDSRSGNFDIFAQRFNSSGVAQWAAVANLCSAIGDQSNPQITTDGMGGAIVAWQDGRGTDLDIYAQRVYATGSTVFTANGVGVCVGAGVAQNPVLAADGVNGAVVAWSDLRSGAADIYAYRITSGGANSWGTSGGTLVSNAAFDQTLPAIVNVGGANNIILWNDTRAANPSGYEDIYAQRVDEWGMLGAEPVITSVRDVPNDQGGKVKVSWTASPLDTDPAFRTVDTYAIFRSAPRAAAKSGAAVTRDPAEAMKPGLLYATGSGDKTYYWEYVASQSAYRLPTYSYLVPTTSDSLSGRNPRTAFLIEARTSTTRWWPSDPDSGYSVDNLPPAAPAFLASRRIADATRVRWTRNAEADLAEYRLYRGASSGFAPDAANLVAALPDTGYVDNGASPYVWYKLTAVDAHGNESPVASLSPQQISGVPGDGVPMATALAGAVPNPFNPSTVISYSLGRPETVRLAVYDAAGRLVRTLAGGAEAAGQHQVRWDGTADDGSRAASGVYFCRLDAGTFSDTRRLTLVK